MELTYKDLLDAQQHLGELLQLRPAPTARMAAQIARNARMVEQTLKDFNAARDVLINPHKVDGKFDEGVLEPEVRVALYAEYDELLQTPVDVDIHPLKIEDIETVEKAKPGFEIPQVAFWVMPWMFEEG